MLDGGEFPGPKGGCQGEKARMGTTASIQPHSFPTLTPIQLCPAPPPGIIANYGGGGGEGVPIFLSLEGPVVGFLPPPFAFQGDSQPPPPSCSAHLFFSPPPKTAACGGEAKQEAGGLLTGQHGSAPRARPGRLHGAGAPQLCRLRGGGPVRGLPPGRGGGSRLPLSAQAREGGAFRSRPP